MFPSEMVILMAIAGARDFAKKLPIRSMDVTGEYIGYLCDSLVRRGYLKKNYLRSYQITSQGRDALEFLHKNKTRVKDTIKMLQQLGIEISQETGEKRSNRNQTEERSTLY